MIFLFAFLGAWFRRWWGEGDGITEPSVLAWPGAHKDILKKFLGFAVSMPLCTYAVHPGSLIEWGAAALMALIIGLGWISPVPPGHNYGTWMGNNGKPDNKGRLHSVPVDFLALWLCYFVLVTLPVGLIWRYMAGDIRGLYYAPLGLLVPFVYFGAKLVYDKFGLGSDQKGSWARALFGAYTVIGEFALGAIIYGGLGIPK